MSNHSRRGFLKLFGLGTAVVLSHDEIVKQIQAPQTAPPELVKSYISTAPMASGFFSPNDYRVSTG